MCVFFWKTRYLLWRYLTSVFFHNILKFLKTTNWRNTTFLSEGVYAFLRQVRVFFPGHRTKWRRKLFQGKGQEFFLKALPPQYRPCTYVCMHICTQRPIPLTRSDRYINIAVEKGWWDTLYLSDSLMRCFWVTWRRYLEELRGCAGEEEK